MDFGSILKKGKRIFNIKQDGQWGKCEACDARQILFSYSVNNNKNKWMLCSTCLETFIKDEK